MVVANQELGKIEDVYGRPNKMTFYRNFKTQLGSTPIFRTMNTDKSSLKSYPSFRMTVVG